MNYGAYRAVCARINRRLGINWTPHDLRHTACVRILDAGMALHEIMGHRHLTAFITNTRGGHVGRGSSWLRPETTVPGIPETTLRYRGCATNP